MSRRPAPDQPTLNFTRGEQLALRRSVRLPPAEKFLLWLIDDHIGGGRSWPLAMADLATESGYSQATVYRAVAALTERGVIFWEPLADGRREFFVCWATLQEIIEQPPQPSEPTELAVSEAGQASHGENDVLMVRTPFSQGESDSHGENDHSHSENAILTMRMLNTKNALLTPSNALSTPSSTPAVADDRKAAVMMLVKAAGVGQFGKAVETALAGGSGLDQVAETVEFYRRHPGRWPPEVLFERLTRAGASLLAPEEGWYGERPAWTAAQQHTAKAAEIAEETERMNRSETAHPLEAVHGAELDALTEHEQLARLPSEFLKRLYRKTPERAKSPLLRQPLLEALAREAQERLVNS